MAAIEVARTLADRGVHTRHPLEVVLFQNEEGGKTGSRAWSGEVEPAELDIVTASGKAIRDGIAFLGGDPDRLDDARRERGSVAAYLELHIEQGAVLERAGIPIGVVEGIVGIKRWSVTVTGFANHAGTTPMDQRRDALVAAADFTSRVYDHVRDRPGRQVATVGRIAAEPGAPNVIPGRVTLSLEVRDLSMETIDAVFAELEREARAIGRAREVEFAFERFYVSRAAPTDPRLRDIVEQSAAGLTLTTQRMPSGAGHDAQSVAQFAPVGMIFVPSRGGISHSPREYTSPEHVIHGANVLLRATMLADARNW
jgi:N-carbamoyl-L-amino-acid hydrolase